MEWDLRTEEEERRKMEKDRDREGGLDGRMEDGVEKRKRERGGGEEEEKIEIGKEGLDGRMEGSPGLRKRDGEKRSRGCIVICAVLIQHCSEHILYDHTQFIVKINYLSVELTCRELNLTYFLSIYGFTVLI